MVSDRPGAYAGATIAVAALVLWLMAPRDIPGAQLLADFVRWLPALLHGFAINVAVSIGALTFGTVLGVFVGSLSLARGIVGRAARLWVQAFRNAPWLVLIFFTTYVFPFEFDLGGHVVPFPDWLKVVAALALPASANIAEVFRGAVQSIPSTQWDAAGSLAMSRRQILLLIVLPQCMRRMLPPWMNVYAIITMGTALSSLVGIHDVLDTAQIASTTVAHSSFTVLMYMSALALFFVYCYPVTLATRAVERRLRSR
ncbi:MULTISPECIES: amino acid ABC transporter permease [unclassified Caballeronia]|uniref:amino acid ABC transporter permease n=1 Tax=unclassified Caballeronia TaxID=2646786 RepID=UPI00285F0362|nr:MULTISPECIES: amino acid ABC transporter permease [unclassified Caballeronia]MDR5773913.1 amino acid ABC transporter permease [Caballeronia sp. LZ002]MDR5849348.1 amino acid ABC transporter permease [Caballeronia sp. LZ003]